MGVRGLLIVFSGLDGAGKSTQIERLLKQLRRDGHDPVYLWSRGGYTPLFEGLKTMLRRLPGRALPAAGPNARRTQALGKGRVRRLWLVLAMLDLAWVYGAKIRWWRRRGRPVICDRYLWDTLVDFRLNFGQEQVESWWLWRVLKQISPQPDAAFLLLVPVEESARRLEAKGLPHTESEQVLAQRLSQYQGLAQTSGWQVLDGRRSVESLAGEIWDALPELKGLENG